MAVISKTQGIELFAIQAVAIRSVTKSVELEVLDKLAATIFIHSTAIGSGTFRHAEYRVEASSQSTGNEWSELVAIPVTTNDSLLTTEAYGSTPAGSSDVTTQSLINSLDPGELILFKNTTITNSEWSRVKTTEDYLIHLVDPLTRNQHLSEVYSKSQDIVIPLDLTSIGRIRLVADNTQNIQGDLIVEAYIVITDYIS